MPKVFDAGAEKEQKEKQQFSVVTGFVTNNCDLLGHGRVLVRIPSMDQEIWARLTAPGAGAKSGLFFPPKKDAEVLVAMVGGEMGDAFILGGLWNMKDKPPSTEPPLPTKKTLRTGETEAAGHEMEFDDLLQSVTITTSTKQTVKLDPKKIEISTTAGGVTITLDVATQSVTIKALKSIDLQAIESISMKAAKVSIESGVQTEVKSTGQTVIKGLQVMIN